MNKSDLVAYAVALPKADLHLHIEGTLEPAMMLSLARRNKTDTPYATVDDIDNAYQFSDRQQFVEIYQQSQQVLRTEEDFFDLTMAYLNRVCAHNVRHAEITFSPQDHITRGVTLNTIVGGILTALSLAKMQFGMTTALIMNFSSHFSEDTAFETLHLAEPWLEQITGVSLSEVDDDHAPSKFKKLFIAVHERGLKSAALFGGNTTPAPIRDAMDHLKVERIGHSNHALQDDALVERLSREKMIMTVCPLSDMRLQVVDTMNSYPLKDMLNHGLHVTVNTDAPAFFGGYVLDNFKAIIDALDLTQQDIKTLAKNSFAGSFLPEGQKRAQISAVDLV